jgi:hypothetical protein
VGLREPERSAATDAPAPTVAPLVSNASTLENSASRAGQESRQETTSEALPSSASSALGARVPPAVTKKPPAKSKPAAPLERRGNERYGRFE